MHAESATTLNGLPGEPVLVAEQVSVRRGKRVLIDKVDLTLHRGETVVVIGPNGVGKSTLLRVIAGLLPARDGRIERRGRVAAALQSPTLAHRTVKANLHLAMAWWRVPRGERAERVQSALAAVHIEHLADRMASTLSGGEARRVHFARALALRSDVLLLDEPFAGLDPPTRAALLRDSSAVFRDPGRATFVVVHDRAEAWALGDRLLVLLDGRVAAEGPPSEVLEQPSSVGVAEFLGFSGRVTEPDGALRYVRPANVVIDAGGDHEGTVAQCVPEEDGVLVDILFADGRVQARAPYPGPRPGDRVRVRIEGGVRFSGEAALPATEPGLHA